MTPTRRSNSVLNLIVLSCFFLSGLSALVYEVVWVRLFDKVIGSAPFAVAAILTVFMGGLALGSFLAGRRIDRLSKRGHLLSLYGRIELGIGAYALVLPLLTVMVRPVYSAAYHHLFDSFWLYNLLAFLGCAVLLLLPAVLMGATLPILCRFYVARLDHLGSRTGRLYGLNTAGAAVGACLTGFLFIQALGVWGSIFLAAGINALVGLLCVVVGRREIPAEAASPTDPADAEGAEPVQEPGAGWALWIFAVSGFCAMAYQVIWTRLLGLIIGPTTYSFTLVVTVFIVGLALGSFVFGRIGDRVRRPLRLLAATQLMAGGLALGVSQFLGNSQFFFAKLIYTFQEHFIQLMTAQSALIFLVLLGPTLLLGATFPLVSKIYARSLERMGRAIGTAYALNTVGAILGSFAAGFLLVPLLGKQDSLRLVTGVQIAVALGALAFYGIRARTRAFLWLPVSGATAVVSAVLLTAYPAWDRQLLSFGRYHNFQNLKPRLTATSWLTALWNGPDILTRSEAGREVVFYGDGIAGFTTVERLTDSMGTVKFTMLNSGKPDASSHGDRSTQTLLAHVPLLFHAHAKTVMVLGLASGMTAGEVLHYPVERVDVVEISKEVVEACRIFGPWNNNILGDARSRIIVQDGRNHLALTKETYDVITSEPSNPWMAGLANLYTLEFFQTVKRRLREGGIFVQWIHSYEMDWPTFALAGRTFSRVFPNSLLMTTLTGLGDYLLVGFKGSGGLDLKVARKNLPYAEKSRNMTLKDPRLIYQLIVSEDLKALFGPGPIHTDNRPRLEFSAPKQLYQSGTSVDETVAQRRSLSQKTREIVRATSSADGLLDMLAFSASAYSPLFGILNPDTATPAQRDRYFRILQSYCDRNLVETYTPFPNQATRESCARRQIKRIRQHLSEAPGDASGYYSLGIALKEAGHGDEAVKAYAKAVSLNPQNADAYNNLGIIHMENGDLKKARDACGKALAVDPTHANALFNLAQIALREGKKDEALSHLRKGLQYEDNPVAKRLVREILLSD